MPANFASGFFVRNAAWHKQGIVLTDPPRTVYEALLVGGLDFEVKAYPLSTVEGYPSRARSIRKVTPTGPGRELGTCGQEWAPVQNSDTFAVLDPLVNSGRLSLETGGVLGHGEHTWLLGRWTAIPATDVGAGDTVRPYLMLSNGLDGRTAIRAGETGVRIVCQNTLSLALKGLSKTRNELGSVP